MDETDQSGLAVVEEHESESITDELQRGVDEQVMQSLTKSSTTPYGTTYAILHLGHKARN